MATHLVCPICGKEFECKGPHEGPHDVQSPITECPLQKGSIYVFVKDSAQEHVPNVKTFCKSDEDETDKSGFAFFQQLSKDTYETRIDLEKSDDKVKNKYYATARVSVPAKVEPGKITVVEFVLNRYADLLVRLKGKEEDSPLPKAKFDVRSSGHTPDVPVQDAVKGKAEYKKLKPTETYTVKCELDKEDSKNFKIDRTEQTKVTVNPDKEKEVVFLVEPRYWIEVALKEEKESGIKGKFSLKHSAGDNYNAEDVGSEMKLVEDLKPGMMDVEGVTLDESREFASLA